MEMAATMSFVSFFPTTLPTSHPIYRIQSCWPWLQKAVSSASLFLLRFAHSPIYHFEKNVQFAYCDSHGSVDWRNEMDGANSVTFEKFPNFAMENTASRRSQNLPVLQHYLNVMSIYSVKMQTRRGGCGSERINYSWQGPWKMQSRPFRRCQEFVGVCSDHHFQCL